MNPVVRKAFYDELEKISLKLPKGSIKALWKGGKELTSGTMKKGGRGVGNFFRRNLVDGFSGGKTLAPDQIPMSTAFKGLRKHPGKFLKDEWDRQDRLSKGMSSVMAGMDAHTVATSEGQDRSAALGSAVANQASNLAFNRLPIVPQMALQLLSERAGNAAGRGIGSAVGLKKMAPEGYPS